MISAKSDLEEESTAAVRAEDLGSPLLRRKPKKDKELKVLNKK
jgi:hypothetical protein